MSESDLHEPVMKVWERYCNLNYQWLPEEYLSQEVRRRILIGEMERELDDYIILVDLMTNEGKIHDVFRLQKLLKENPGSLDLMIKIGICRRKIYDFNKDFPGFIRQYFKGRTTAKDFFAEAVEVDKYHVQILYNTTKLAVDDKDLEKYERTLKILKEHHPNSPWTMFVQGHYLVDNKKYEQAIELLESNQHLFKKCKSCHKYSMIKLSRSYKSLKKTEKYLEVVERMNNLFGSTRDTNWGFEEIGWYHVQQAFQTLGEEQEKHTSKAELIFKKSMKIKLEGHYYALGVVAELRKDDEKMQEMVMKELNEICCYNTRCLFMLIDLHLKKDENNLAMQVIDKLLFIEPSLENHMKKSRVLEKVEGDVPSLDYLKRIVDRFQNDKKIHCVYYDMGICAFNSHQNSEAEEFMKESIRRNPKYELPHYGLGKVYESNLEFDKAIKEYDFLIHLYEENGSYKNIDEVYLAKAYIYDFNFSDFEKAIRYYKLGLKHLPARRRTLEMVLDLESRICFCKADISWFGKAYRSCKKLIEKYQNNAEFLEKKDDPASEDILQIMKDLKKLEEKLLSNNSFESLMRGRKMKVAVKDEKERMLYLDETMNGGGMKKMAFLEEQGTGLFVFEFFVKYNIL